MKSNYETPEFEISSYQPTVKDRAQLWFINFIIFGFVFMCGVEIGRYLT